MRVVVESRPSTVALVERAAVEGEEVGALAARDVDDLDVLALEDLEALGAGDIDADVETRLGERLGQARLAGRQRPWRGG